MTTPEDEYVFEHAKGTTEQITYDVVEKIWRENLQGERRGRTSERADELELWSGLWAAWEPLALLDKLPFLSDEMQSMRTVSRDA